MLALLSGMLGAAASGSKTGGRPDITEPTLRRFSALAGFSLLPRLRSPALVNASIRLTSWNDLFGSAYGAG